jgi:hypothetical protein
MTCKYWDAGWCYAPEDVEHNSKGGKCIEPEYCSYLMENKTLMTEKEHLECEIMEYELEIEQKVKAIGNLKYILEKKEQQLKEMNDSTNRLGELNCFPKVIDENTIVIDGVEYKKVEEPKPQTLFNVIYEWRYNTPNETCDDLVMRIDEWFPELGVIQPPLYAKGWEDCINHLRNNIK